MKYQILSVVIIFVVGCSSTQGTGPTVTGPDRTRQEVVLVTSSGNTINMNGGWQAVCVAQGSVFLSEEFTFSGPTLRIDIQAYGASDCQGTPLDTETVTLSFTPRGPYAVDLAGKTVTANRIEGEATSNKDNKPERFKQAFYVDDTSGQYRLYHGVFSDDGGRLTVDGYPMDLHAVAIIRQ